MRGLTSTIVLVLVLGGLLGYIYFGNANGTQGETETKPKAFQVSSDEIEELQVKSVDGASARVQLADSAWRLIEPQTADADPGVVSSMTSSLASLEVQRVVDENPGDLKQYGLDPPRIDVAFRTKGGKDFQHLLVGEKTPTGGDLYAKKANESRVFLISSFLDAAFNKSPFDLRDKTVLKFERDTADGVELVTDAGAIQLSRSGTDWTIVKPIAARADYAAAEGVVSRLTSAQMQNVVVEAPADLEPYGLEKPSLTVSLTGGSSRATLLLGASADEGVFAKDAARPMVFTIEPGLATELRKELSDFRRKDIFDARSFTANRVELRRGADTLILERTKSDDGKEMWRTAAGQNADTTKVEDLLTRLSGLRADTFLPTVNPALKAPALTATVRFDEKKTETVTIARAGSEIVAARADEPGSARVDAAAFEEVIKAMDGLK